MVPLSLSFHTVSATVSMGTRRYNKLHLKLGQICLNKLGSLGVINLSKPDKGSRGGAESVGACRDTVRADLENLMVLWELHFYPGSSTVHKPLFKH